MELKVEKVEFILAEVARWARCRTEIAAIALVGSWARGMARVDSDVDLMLLSANPSWFRDNPTWLDEINWSIFGTKVNSWEDKDYGAIWSRHVLLDDGSKIEFSFGLHSWASIDPIDPGTFRVVNDGCQIIYDPEQLLARLIDRID
jgi:uncharacterized protein